MKRTPLTMLFYVILFFPFVGTAILAQTQPLASTATGTPLIAYRFLFRHVQHLENLANAASTSAQDATQFRNQYQITMGLSDSESAQLKQISAAALSALDAIEQQAAEVIQAERAKYPKGKLPSKNALPPPPPELAQLQQERDDVTRSNVQSLQGALSATSFTNLDNWVKSHYTPNGIGQPRMPPSGMPSPLVPQPTP
jgi:hypothetical protein